MSFWPSVMTMKRSAPGRVPTTSGVEPEPELVLAVSSVLVVLSPSMFAQFSYRYGLPLLVLLPPAGAVAADIGLDALRARRELGGRVLPGRGRRGERPAGAMGVPGKPSLTGARRTAPNGGGLPPERARDLQGKNYN